MLSVIAGLLVAILGSCGSPGRQPRPAPLDPADRDHDGEASIEASGPDCDDGDPRVWSGAAETCNGRDDDCDGRADEDFDCVVGVEAACGAGSVAVCGADCSLGTCGPPAPCTSDSRSCTPGEREACASACGRGERVCSLACDWGPCQPPPERCNGLDDDCDGLADEGLWGPASGLSEVDTSMSVPEVVVAATEERRVALAARTGRRIDLYWTNEDAEPIGAAQLVRDHPDVVGDLRAVAAGSEVVITYALAGGTTGVSVAGVDGLRAQWTQPRSGTPIPVWTGDRLLIVAWRELSIRSLEGDELEPVATLPLPPHAALWHEGGLVIASGRSLLRLAADWSEEWWIELDRPGAPLLAAEDHDLVAVQWPVDGAIVATRFATDGATVWSLDAPVPLSFRPVGVAVVEGGWLVVASDNELAGQHIGGWWIASDGSSDGGPQWWLRTPLDYGPSVTSVGGTAWMGTSARSVARLGCVSTDEGGSR